jgi:hypothetical protein
MANVYHVRALFDLGVSGELAGFHLDFEPGSTTVEAAQALLTMDAVWDWWDSDLGSTGAPGKAYFSPDTKLARVTFQRTQPTPPGPVYTDIRAAIAGTNGGNACPPQVAAGVTYRTALNTRRGRGRSYFPPPSEGDVAVGGLLTSALSYAQKAKDLATLVESPAYLSVGTVSMNHVVYSAADNASRAVVTYQAGTRCDTQRKRLGKEQTYVTA